MGYRHIAVRAHARHPAAAEVILDRPDVRNAMDENTLCELADVFRGFSRREDLRAVVVRGEGKSFCAGADIEWMRRAGKLKGAEAKEDAMFLTEMCRAVDECPVPVIAVARGAVYGGGLGLVSACDVVIAETEAQMCFSECRLGIMPAVISCFVIPKIGAANARRYYLTGEVFGMQAARLMGLVHEIVDEAELEAKLDSTLGDILRCGPIAAREAKAFIRKFSATAKFDERVDLAIDTLVRLRSSPEGQEGLSAFLEKRKASWVQ